MASSSPLRPPPLEDEAGLKPKYPSYSHQDNRDAGQWADKSATNDHKSGADRQDPPGQSDPYNDGLDEDAEDEEDDAQDSLDEEELQGLDLEDADWDLARGGE